jgi:hypothetical protein
VALDCFAALAMTARQGAWPSQSSSFFARACRIGAMRFVLNVLNEGSSMTETQMVWTGRVLSGLFVLFMLGASVTPKLLGMPIAEETMKMLGWPPGHVLWIGLLELALVILYIYPRTNVLGAVLFMALFGGAMATQIRVGSGLFSHVLFSVYLGLFMWGGLWLRDAAVRTWFPLRRDL